MTFPLYFTINEQPVKLVLLQGDEIEAHAFDFTTGLFAPDRSYFSRASDMGPGHNVEQISEAGFESLVAELRREISERRQASVIVWRHTGDGEFPYEAEVEGQTFTIRINDFPDQPLYTLLAGDKKVEDMEDWPSAWVRPESPQSLLDMLDRTNSR